MSAPCIRRSIQYHPGHLPQVRHGAGTEHDPAEEENHELVDMTPALLGLRGAGSAGVRAGHDRRSGACTFAEGLSMRTLQWIEFALATPVVLWGGWPFFVRGWQSVQTWNLNMFTLIGLGVSVAWLLQHGGAVVSAALSARHADGRRSGARLF